LWCSFKLWWHFCLDLSRSKFCSLGNRPIGPDSLLFVVPAVESPGETKMNVGSHVLLTPISTTQILRKAVAICLQHSFVWEKVYYSQIMNILSHTSLILNLCVLVLLFKSERTRRWRICVCCEYISCLSCFFQARSFHDSRTSWSICSNYKNWYIHTHFI
jgi:hypothetical protein